MGKLIADQVPPSNCHELGMIPKFFGQIPRGSNMLTHDILAGITQSVDPNVVFLAPPYCGPRGSNMLTLDILLVQLNP